MGFSIDFAYGALTQCSATALLVIVCVQLLGGFAPQTPWGHDQGLYPWTPLGAQPPDPRHSPPPNAKTKLRLWDGSSRAFDGDGTVLQSTVSREMHPDRTRQSATFFEFVYAVYNVFVL